jgi:hypothetical protein
VLVAIWSQFAIGLAFALVAQDRIRADGPSTPPAILLVLSYAGIIVAPVALYFYAVHPAWTWHYAVNPAQVPTLAIVPLVVAHALVVVGGWYLGAMLVRRDRRRTHRYGIAAAGLLTLLAIAALFPRLLAATSYRGYQAGVVGRLMNVELGWAILVSGLATAAASGYVLFELARDSRRVRSR